MRDSDFSTEEMLNGLREGELQLALLKRPSDKSLRGLVFEELNRFPVCVATNRTHRLARPRRVGLHNLAGERFIGYARAEYPEYHEWLGSLFVPLAPPVIAEEHDSSTSLIAAVEAGRGVALVQQGFEFLAGPRLKVWALYPAPVRSWWVSRMEGKDFNSGRKVGCCASKFKMRGVTPNAGRRLCPLQALVGSSQS